MLRPQDLVGVEEIAILAKVSPSAVANWPQRLLDFPAPISSLAGGPVFHGAEIVTGLARRAQREGAAVEKKTCFVISPIGDELAPADSPARHRWEQSIETWEKLIEPACVTAGLEPTRADQIARTGEITVQVFTLIRDADLVIADVTNGNPN